MKSKILALTVSLAFPLVCAASTKDAANTFMQGLVGLQTPCESMGPKFYSDQDAAHLKLSMDNQVAAVGMGTKEAMEAQQISEIQQNGDDQLALLKQRKLLGDCEATAKEAGVKLYKDFVVSVKEPNIKGDGKKVFAAWLSYIDSLVISRNSSDNDNQQQAALIQAESELNVDML